MLQYSKLIENKIDPILVFVCFPVWESFLVIFIKDRTGNIAMHKVIKNQVYPIYAEFSVEIYI